MIDVQQAPDNDILEVKVVEKLSSSDFDHLKPVLDKHIAESVSPGLLLVMEEFSGYSDAAAFWKDLKMDTEYMGDFERVALIGDASWEEWMTKLMDPVTSSDLKYFDRGEAEHARRWLRQ